MAEFYVTYEHAGQKYLAIVIAPTRPAAWQFASLEVSQTEMDALGNDWELHCQIPVPRQFADDEDWTIWRQELAQQRALRNPWKPDVYLAGQGGGGAGFG